MQVRNNIMVALTDLTVQYTALVDAHVPRLAACLRDPHELVRRQTLALLASLLSRVGEISSLSHADTSTSFDCSTQSPVDFCKTSVKTRPK